MDCSTAFENAFEGHDARSALDQPGPMVCQPPLQAMTVSGIASEVQTLPSPQKAHKQLLEVFMHTRTPPVNYLIEICNLCIPAVGADPPDRGRGTEPCETSEHTSRAGIFMCKVGQCCTDMMTQDTLVFQ